jgi:FAD/FMN-containing dehydrogenase
VPGVKRGFEVMAEHGYPPSVVTRPMRGGRYAVLRFIAIFDRNSPEECARVRRLNEALADVCVDLGYFPYKSPAWAVERYRDRFDPGFIKQFAALRRHLDPLGIMNPGQWPTGDA